MNTTITTGYTTSFTEGDVMTIAIENSLWKLLWHFILRKNLKRYDIYKIKEVNETTITVE